jgi:hypothetical protein
MIRFGGHLLDAQCVKGVHDGSYQTMTTAEQASPNCEARAGGPVE